MIDFALLVVREGLLKERFIFARFHYQKKKSNAEKQECSCKKKIVIETNLIREY